MKNSPQFRDGVSKGAALMIVLAFVVLLTVLMLAYFSRAGTDRQLAQSSYNYTWVDLLARSALDVVVGDFKRELLDPANRTITAANIQPSPYPRPTPSDIFNLIRYSSRNAAASRASNVSSDNVSANGRSISKARWNSHYLVPKGNTATSDSAPIPSFTAPDWVLVTAQGPNSAPAPSAVIGRYAFAVYDEGGLLDMSQAGYPSFANVSGCPDPAPTPWLVNVGRKGIVAFADLTAFPFSLSQSQIDKIVGWRNYAMTQQPASFFPSGNPSFPADCTRQNSYGSYLLYFGDPPFTIESLADKLAASIYPFTSVPSYIFSSPGQPLRTDQAFMTRQQLLKFQRTLDVPPGQFSPNVLQYMGTFSRERNRPAPDWPHLSEPGETRVLNERFNMNNLGLVLPNPCNPAVDVCTVAHGKKKGWQTGKNRNHLIGTIPEIVELFGLFWVKADVIDPSRKIPGHWTYIYHTGPNPPGDPDPNPNSIICFRDPGGSRQKDFFQILHYALNVARNQTDRCGGAGEKARTFGIGASLIDQYDSGEACSQTDKTGCDLDLYVGSKGQTHTTVIRYGQGAGISEFAFGMEPNWQDDNINGDELISIGTNHPHRPCGGQGGDCVPGELPAPNPVAGTQVISHAFSNVGEFGYGIDTSVTGLPVLKFWDNTNNPPTRSPFQDAPVLDFFSYNPISSAYPRAGIVNLYTKNKEVIAAMLKSALKQDTLTPPSSSIVVSQNEAMSAAQAIVNETQRVLAGSPTYASVQQTDLTRAIAGRLARAAADAVSSLNATDETRNTVARALAEMGQTRTWNLFIDVIAQTGRYAPGTANVTDANKFTVEGEKRYWLHIALGRDLVRADGTPCAPDESGCQVDVLGTQLEEVVE